MGELLPGDVIYDETGSPTVVKAISQIWDDRACYEVCFDDHTSIVADAEHLWLTWDKKARVALNPNRRGVAQPRVRSTATMLDTLRYGSQLEANHAIDVAGALQGSGNLPIDPYFLGYWLGDGNTDTSEITTADEWVLDELERRGLRVVDRRSKLHYGITYPHPHNRKTESPQAQLNRLGVLHNKHIPPAYLRASEADRRLLLAGLVDSDGHMQSNGSCEVTQKKASIADGLVELLRSLGEKPRVSIKQATCNGVPAGPVHRVTWRPRSNPARMPRKANAFMEPGRTIALSQRRVIDIRQVCSRPVRCITVDSPSHLFLAGEGMVPTHNSVGKSLSIKLRAFAFPFLWPDKEMVITAPELNHMEAITELVEGKFYSCRLGREILNTKRGGVTHRPFSMKFYNGARIMGRIPQKDGKGVKGCVGEGTLILTATGYRPVETLQVGDLVMTHTGEWQPMTSMREDINDCYRVTGQGSHPLTVSCDHRFLGAYSTNQPKQKLTFSDPYFEDVDFLLDGQGDFYWSSPTKFSRLEIPSLAFNGTANRFPMNEDFWWLVGRYLADGHLSHNKQNGKERKVHWSVHPADQEDITTRLKRLGLKASVATRDHSSADILTTYSAALNRWLLEHFGQHADGKRVPGFALGMSWVNRMELLQGYLSGDGHRNQERHRWEMGSASQALVLGMQMIAQGCGYTVNCSQVQPPVTEICGTTLKQTPKPSWRIQIMDIDHGHAHRIEGKLFAKVHNVEYVGKQKVYNPVIEGNHSYISNSIISHNVHPIWLELDEGQDYPDKGWLELIETLQSDVEGSVWRAHGVTRGVRDYFYKFTQPESEWTVHRFTAMHRDGWTDGERQAKISMYGSRKNPDYRRNVLGLHGDATNPLFVLSRLMACVDDDIVSEYNTEEYAHTKIDDSYLEDVGGEIVPLLNLPAVNPLYKAYWAGMDVGLTRDPSEILVFGEYRLTKEEERHLKRVVKDDYGVPQPRKATPKDGQSRLKLLCRISLERIGSPEQSEVIAAVIRHFKPKTFAMDSTGLGLPIFQQFQHDHHDMIDIIKGYGFSKKILVDFDERIKVDPHKGNAVEEQKIEAPVLEYSTEVLRRLVDAGRLWLPWDTELIGAFQGQTYTEDRGVLDMYGRKRFSKGDFHTLDAARMAALAHKQFTMDIVIAQHHKQEDVLDMGFTP